MRRIFAMAEGICRRGKDDEKSVRKAVLLIRMAAFAAIPRRLGECAAGLYLDI
jgi:hypothetical protein